MAEFRWIQMLLFLILMLQFKAVTGQYGPTFLIRDGDEVTLPCQNVIVGQPECGRTDWLFKRLNVAESARLIHLGLIEEKHKYKSDRLSVTAKCSLVIKNITVHDAGQYTCTRDTSQDQQHCGKSCSSLSIINMTEHENNGTVILSCSVLEYDPCTHTVEWIYEGEEKSSDMQISPPGCTATVTFTTSHLNQKFFELLKCKVTNQNSKKVQLFPFSRQSSGGTTDGDKSSDGGSLLPYIIVLVCLVALLIVVAFITWKKTKGKKTQMEDNAVSLNTEGLGLNPAEIQSDPGKSQEMDDPEDGVNYASISYTKKANSKASAQVHDDESDTVTYSTVKAPSASLEVSTDPSNLYSTITK
ncbi:uncharacterized protein LOC116326782 isoform X2 [Oreochromis aureus]|uniref:uncharacterized protein LOC116326782 isoform X2 n=1 Tax=Oreochromis aureus TaxID=47969 RepID=UPI00195473C3|nr:uncharacterized protein LOC116326782 isoform X2 [Oreochromis aureus]